MTSLRQGGVGPVKQLAKIGCYVGSCLNRGNVMLRTLDILQTFCGEAPGVRSEGPDWYSTQIAPRGVRQGPRRLTEGPLSRIWSDFPLGALLGPLLEPF